MTCDKLGVTCRRWRALAMMGLLPAILGASCIFSSAADYLHGKEEQRLQVVTTEPLDGAADVALDVRLAVDLNDRLHPDSLVEGAVTLTRDGSEVGIVVQADLIWCRLVVRPVEELAPNADYLLEFSGLRGFQTIVMGGPEQVTFTTGTALDGPDAAAPTIEEIWTDLFEPHCTSCHTNFRPPGGVDLSTPAAAEASLVDKPSTSQPERKLVAPGNHGASYLMHKLLDLPGIIGQPMPAPGDWPIDRNCGTPDPELRALAAWIDSLP